jgi:hypothetical protein
MEDNLKEEIKELVKELSMIHMTGNFYITGVTDNEIKTYIKKFIELEFKIRKL